MQVAHLTPEDIVRKEYSDPAIVKYFSSIGLWDSEAELVDRYFPAGGRILDIGCGVGRTTIPLAKKGFRVTAIDLMKEMVDAASLQVRDHGVDVSLHVMDVSELDFLPNAFDGALFSFNGYESIPSHERRKAAIRAVERVLQPGACFILTARSGIAFGRRWVAWVWMVFRQFILRPLGLANPHLNLGDMCRRGMLHHYISPFAVRKDLREGGFQVELFTSDRNIRRRRGPTFFTNFSADICLFYVARKVG